MRTKHLNAKKSAEEVVKDIRRTTRRHFLAKDKIRIVLEGLRGDDSIAELCRKEGIAQSLYYTWSKEFMEAGKRRLAGDTARAATTDEVKTRARVYSYWRPSVRLTASPPTTIRMASAILDRSNSKARSCSGKSTTMILALNLAPTIRPILTRRSGY
jgi:transposase